MKVVVGEHDKTEGQHQGEHAVSAILPHPAYTAAPPYPHDAALLTLAAPLTFSARVAPVCLPAAASLYAGRVATVTGWGSTLVLGASSAVLREANVTIMANEECGEAFSDSFDSPWIKKYFAKTLISSFIYAILVFIFARMGAVRVFVAETLAGQCFCWRMEGTLRFGDGMSSCHVMCARNTQVGVTSWGAATPATRLLLPSLVCNTSHYPGLFTRVSTLKPWILANTEGTQDSNC